MSIRRGRPSDLLVGFAMWAAIVGGPLAAAADEPGPASISHPGPDAPEVERIEYWRGRADEARERVAVARRELDAANGAVARMQRRNHPRGEARQALRDDQRRARVAYEAAQTFLEVELPAEARQAAAPVRWLRASR